MNRKKGNGLFDWEELRYAWHFHKLTGVVKWFTRELRFARQRIRQGYCDMDAWNLYHWFLDVIPDMIQDLKENGTGFPCSGGPTVSQSISVEVFNRVTGDNRTESDEDQETFKRGLAEWHAILDRMVFLFHEADEERCERTNSHQAEYQAAYREFIERYGMFGEKLRRPEDENSHGHRLYTLRDVDEYREIAEEYRRESREIDQYRVKCKDEAFQLFSQWFYGLWD
jgi:hypothetical protein